MTVARLPDPDPEYPETVGGSRAEGDFYREWMSRLIELMKRRFSRDRVYVSGGLLIYYEEGNPRKFVCPDLFIVRDHPPHNRRNYLLWREKRVPNFILETTCNATRREDGVTKMRLYRRLGVKEYLLYDPTSHWLNPPLQGFRLTQGRYLRIESASDESILSLETGVRFRLEGADLVLFDEPSGVRLKSGEERWADLQARS